MALAQSWLLAREEARKGPVRTLHNVYYDTPGADLNRQRIALRVRAAGDRYIQTLKTQGVFVNGAHRRQEWEWPLLTPDLNLGLIADTPVAQSVNVAELAPAFETNFERQIVMLDDGSSLIECALDRGEIKSGDHRRTLNEVELELKGGSPDRLRVWAGWLASEVPVFLNLVSKAEQGYWLAGLYQPGKVPAGEGLTGLLRCLSNAWLTGERPNTLDHCLSDLRAQAHGQGLGTEYDWLAQRLRAGVSIEVLMTELQLGQLQLGLLR